MKELLFVVLNSAVSIKRDFYTRLQKISNLCFWKDFQDSQASSDISRGWEKFGNVWKRSGWLIIVRECSGTFEKECSTNLDEGSKLDFLIQNHNLSKMTILIGYFLTPLLTLNRPLFFPNRYLIDSIFAGNGTIIWIIKKPAIFDGLSYRW